MKEIDIIMITGFAAPLISAMICWILLFTHYRYNQEPLHKKPIRVAIYAFTTSVFCWLGVILYIANYHYFVYYNTFFYLALLFNQVLLYNFVFLITDTGRNRKFPVIHYIIPLVICLLLGIWSMSVPFDSQLYIVESRGENADGYFWYSMLFSSSIPAFLLYNLIYSFFGLYRIRQYRKAIIDYSADEDRSSMRWLYLFFFTILLTVPITSATSFIHKSYVIKSPLTLLAAFMPILQYVILSYNLIMGNYVIMSNIISEATKDEETIIRRKALEKYVETKKPYLDPKLRITDVMLDLHTNRSYLSSFINKEYNMNFSTFINQYRLKELERLRKDPAYKDLSEIELVMNAGFSNYRGYQRVKKAEQIRMRPLMK